MFLGVIKSCIPYRLFVLYGKFSQSLEIEGNALFVDLLVGFAVYTHVLRVLGIEGMSLCSYLDILELHVLSTVDHDALFGIVHLQVLDADVLNRLNALYSSSPILSLAT